MNTLQVVNFIVALLIAIRNRLSELLSSKLLNQHLNGKPNGLHNTYYLSGQLKSTGEFSIGVPVGTHREYHADGSVKSVIPYMEGEIHGECYRAGIDKDGLPWSLKHQYQTGEICGVII